MAMKRLLGFLVPVSFLILVFVFVNFGHTFEYDKDEGMYLMRSYLFLKGHLLYKEIWMDQPPLLVLMFSGLFKLFGPSVYSARLLVLLFSVVLLWALYQIISRTQNTWSALWAAGAAALSSYYLKLSVSALSMLPAVALTMVSIYEVFLYHESHKKIYLAFAGVIFACAFMVRFPIIVFLPGIIAEIIATERKRHGSIMRACLWWFIPFATVVLYIGCVVSIDLSQIIQPYLLSRKLHFLSESMLWWFRDAYAIVFLACCALLFSRRAQRKFFLVPLVSLISGITIFSFHNPLWWHYKLCITMPLCWLASFSVYALSSQIREEWKNRNKPVRLRVAVPVFFILIALVHFVCTIPAQYDRIRSELAQQPLASDRILFLMKRYAPYTHLVMTDRPIYAFYAGLPMHPYLVTASSKRMQTGFLTPDDYIAIIRTERPELILFARYFSFRHSRIVPLIKKDYVLECKEGYQYLYVLKSMKERAKGLNPAWQ